MEKQAKMGILLQELQQDLAECWQRLPNKAFFFSILLAWLALFQWLGNSTLAFVQLQTPSLLRWMYMAYKPGINTDDGHGNLIPFVVLVLFWFKRKELLALPLKTWWPGLLLLGFGLLIHVIGYAVQQPRISIIGLFTGIYGLTGLAWGPAWLRASFFPFFLFAFSVPFGTLGQSITLPLRLFVAKVVTSIAHLGLAPDLIVQGTQLMDGQNSFRYDVAPACSGIRSLVSLLALTTIYGFVSFKPAWKRLLMVAAAFPL